MQTRRDCRPSLGVRCTSDTLSGDSSWTPREPSISIITRSEKERDWASGCDLRRILPTSTSSGYWLYNSHRLHRVPVSPTETLSSTGDSTWRPKCHTSYVSLLTTVSLCPTQSRKDRWDLRRTTSSFAQSSPGRRGRGGGVLRRSGGEDWDMTPAVRVKAFGSLIRRWTRINNAGLGDQDGDPRWRGVTGKRWVVKVRLRVWSRV